MRILYNYLGFNSTTHRHAHTHFTHKHTHSRIATMIDGRMEDRKRESDHSTHTHTHTFNSIHFAKQQRKQSLQEKMLWIVFVIYYHNIFNRIPNSNWDHHLSIRHKCRLYYRPQWTRKRIRRTSLKHTKSEKYNMYNVLKNCYPYLYLCLSNLSLSICQGHYTPYMYTYIYIYVVGKFKTVTIVLTIVLVCVCVTAKLCLRVGEKRRKKEEQITS